MSNTKPNSSQITYDTGVNKQDLNSILDTVVPIADYTALRNYTGRATQVRITSDGIAGFFKYDSTDTTSTDNGGTIIVAGTKRWKRVFDVVVNVKWFGAKGDGVADDTVAIQIAIAACGYTGNLYVPFGMYLTDPLDLRMCRNFTLTGDNESTSSPWLSSRSTVIKIKSAGDVGIKTATVDELPISNYAKHVTIKNIYLNCNGKVTDGINCLQGTYIENCEVRYAVRDGVVLEQTSYPVTVVNCVLAQNGRDGLRVKPQFTTVYSLRDIDSRQNGGNGYTIYGGSGAQFNNCLAQANAGTGFTVKLFDPATSSYVLPVYLEKLIFIGCYSEGNGGWGFLSDSYNTEPATYIGKIDKLTFINCSFNSSTSQQASLRGLCYPLFINSPFLSDALDSLYNTVAIERVIVQGAIRPKYGVDLTSSTAGNIVFPAVQNPSTNANTLDDYEEGVWTPGISQTGTIYFTPSTVVSGTYQKIGNHVYCTVTYEWTDKGSASGVARATLGNLPYNCSSALQGACGCVIQVSGGSTDDWAVWPQSGSNTVYFVKNNATGAGALISDLPAAGKLQAQFSYITYS